MPSFPITAYGLCNCLGATPEAILGRLKSGSCEAPAHSFEAGEALGAVLDSVLDPYSRASRRWGAGRVGLLTGSSLEQVEVQLGRRAGVECPPIAGPKYTIGGGAAGVASAQNLLRSGLADAVVVVGLDTEQGDKGAAALLIERQGSSDAKLAGVGITSALTEGDFASALALAVGDALVQAEVSSRRIDATFDLTDSSTLSAELADAMVEHLGRSVPSVFVRRHIDADSSVGALASIVLAASCMAHGWLPSVIGAQPGKGMALELDYVLCNAIGLDLSSCMLEAGDL